MSQPDPPQTGPTSLVTKPSETRLGRTALIVLAISLSMCGALLVLERFGPKDEYDQGVLKILAITVGLVGSIWAFVLLVRGVTRGEPMVAPFAIFLIVFAGLSIPLIQTWDTPERGGDNGWYFFHFACVPLIVPLLTIAFLFATPLFAWKYRRARRSDETQRLSLERCAWRALFLTVGIFFAAVFPVSFYIYGGTMAESAKGEHWTTKVVRALPRVLGDIGYRLVEPPLNRRAEWLSDLLPSRGLVSATFLCEKIEETSQSTAEKSDGLVDWYFNSLVRHYPSDAMIFVRKHFNHFPPTIQSRDMASHFAEFGNFENVREYFTPERYSTQMSPNVSSGLLHGLFRRSDAKALVPHMEKLWGDGGRLPRVALHFLMKFSDDATAKRIYLETSERIDESLQCATHYLMDSSRVNVIASGISQADTTRQQRVLQAVLARQSGTLSVPLIRFRNDPAYRLAILRTQESPDIDNRVMNALIIHQLSLEMTDPLMRKYGLQKSHITHVNSTYQMQLRKFETILMPTRLWRVDLAERNVLIAQARDLMRKW